jgi:hypothetical protein
MDEAWWLGGYVSTPSLLDTCLTTLALYTHRRGSARQVEGWRDAGKVHGDTLGRGDTGATSDARGAGRQAGGGGCRGSGR